MSTENLSLDEKRKIREIIGILRQDTRNVGLWLELESLFDDPDKRREILMGVLVIDAQNPEALERLNHLTGTTKSAFSTPNLSGDLMEDSNVSDQNEKTFADEKDGWHLEDPIISLSADEESETRKCPFCGELIRKDALKCRFCLKYLDDKPPNKAESVSENAEEAEFSGWLKTAIILFIVLGVVSVLVMFIWMIIPLL